jgi:hypothetical protein
MPASECNEKADSIKGDRNWVKKIKGAHVSITTMGQARNKCTLM